MAFLDALEQPKGDKITAVAPLVTTLEDGSIQLTFTAEMLANAKKPKASLGFPIDGQFSNSKGQIFSVQSRWVGFRRIS